MINSYASIYAIGHPAIAMLFSDPVQVEEKIDGSQFSFAKIDGRLHCRSRTKALVIDEPEKMFAEAVETCRSVFDRMPEGVIFRGEYLQKPKHNVLAYDRIPAKHIIIWDAERADGPVSPEERTGMAADLGLETVPVLMRGEVNKECLQGLLETVSVLGGQKIEGVVVKNYARWGRDGKHLCGKLVSTAFKEVNAREWKANNPGGKDVLGLLSDKYRCESRWNKAIQHMAEAGVLESAPEDIGPLLREVQQDVIAECIDEIKEDLWRWAKPHIVRASVRGLPEWYKERLLEKQFAQ